MTKRIHIGTAGWAVPRIHAHACAANGTHLEKYSGVMNAVEINSTFYRPHQAKTFERWVASTPDAFRFSVKLSRSITHEAKLISTGALLAAFFENIRPLGDKLGAVLVQLPPRLAFEPVTVRDFFQTLRELYAGTLVIEPRNASWFTHPVELLLREFNVSRVAADPPAGSPTAEQPGGFSGCRYYRLHGAPRTYWSQYSPHFLHDLAHRLRQASSALETWVIFDNTAGNHAFGDALALRSILNHAVSPLF